jgi:hypothetical protein
MPAADTTTHSLREGDDKDEAHTEGHQPNLAEQSRPIDVETGRFFLLGTPTETGTCLGNEYPKAP